MSTDGGKTFSNIAGATSDSYTTPATNASDNGNQYQAVFTNGWPSVTTNPATLTVLAPSTTGYRLVDLQRRCVHVRECQELRL